MLGLLDAKNHLCEKSDKYPTPYNEYLKKNAIKEVERTKRSLQRNYVNETLENCKGNMSEIWKCLKPFWPTK